jgi:hypothetical protein
LDHDERYGDRRAKAEQRGHDARRAIFDFFQQRWEGAAAA